MPKSKRTYSQEEMWTLMRQWAVRDLRKIAVLYNGRPRQDRALAELLVVFLEDLQLYAKEHEKPLTRLAKELRRQIRRVEKRDQEKSSRLKKIY